MDRFSGRRRTGRKESRSSQTACCILSAERMPTASRFTPTRSTAARTWPITPTPTRLPTQRCTGPRPMRQCITAATVGDEKRFGMIRIGAFALSILALATASSAASADATYQTLHSFSGVGDGANPKSGLVMDAAGNLYGTTPQGGASDMGTLFKVAPDGTFTLLHAFQGGRDGAKPTASALTVDAHGTIYGLTEQGGIANGGTAYRFRGGKLSVLH